VDRLQLALSTHLNCYTIQLDSYTMYYYRNVATYTTDTVHGTDLKGGPPAPTEVEPDKGPVFML